MATPTPPPDTSPAEAVFAEFLEQLEADQPGDFEALCQAHPALQHKLRRLHVRWQAVSHAFGELSTAAGAGEPIASAPPIETLMARLGARISRYAIGPEIARGAMGRVVQAWDEELRRPVALKVHRGDEADARTRRRFLEEAQIAAQLDHPGIVPIHELGLDEAGRPFFSMQLVRGRHLGEILALARKGEEGWSRTRVLNVLLRVCEAMAFAHEKGVVHRDLKPANIMVGRFGETYVMDWGLARVVGSDDTGAEHLGDLDTLRAELEQAGDGSPLLTQDGDVIGTPAYMAPEQALGAGQVAAPAIDVYAVGAILYHLLAGHMPYGEAGLPGVQALLQRVRREPPQRLADDTTPELRAICERAMAREPAQRYPNMVALADDLRAFLEVRTVRAYQSGRFAELRKWIARNRALAASGLLLVLAVSVGAIAVTVLWLRAEQDRSRADANAARLATELDRSAFRSARLALQLDDSIEAGDALWRAHFAGRMPRATTWALAELAERDPYLVTLPVHEDNRPVAFAPGVGAVLVGGVDGVLQVRDADTLALRAEVGARGAALHCIAVLAGGKMALAGNAAGEVVSFDLVGLTELHRVRRHDGPVREIAASRAGGFATGGADGKVLWWPNHEALPRVLLTRPAAISSLTVTPEGDGVMAGDVDGTLGGVALNKSWQVQLAVGGNLTTLASGSRSNELWVGSTTHSLRFFDFVDRSRDFVLQTQNGTCREIARDRDGSVFAGGWWRTNHVAADGRVLSPAALRGISRMALDVEARRLITSGSTCGLGLVDVSSGGDRRLAGGNVALSSDGRRVATVVGGGIELRDVESNEVLRSAPGMAGALALDATGSLIAVTIGHEVHVAEADTARRRFSCLGPASNPFGDSAAFSPDGEQIAVRVGADRIRRLRCKDGQLLAEYVYPGRRSTRLCWSHDGARLCVIGRDDATVCVYHVQDGRREDVVFDLKLPSGVDTSLSAVALAPTDDRVAVGTWSGAVLVRELDGSTTTIPAHEGTVWSVQFVASDPQLLVSSGGSAGIAFWDLDTGECCYHAVKSGATAAQVSSDGNTLACQATGSVLLIDLTYRQRHIAGNLDYQLARQRGRVEIAPARELQLRAWAAEVFARPWPRWRDR